MSEVTEKLVQERDLLVRGLYLATQERWWAETRETFAKARLSVFDEKHGAKLSSLVAQADRVTSGELGETGILILDVKHWEDDL